MTARPVLLASFSALVVLVLVGGSLRPVSATSPTADGGAGPDGKNFECGGVPCAAAARGLQAFFDRDLPGLGGNGRSCADCHVASDSFQLSPATVEARFQRVQSMRQHRPQADDPLFRPIDADDFREKGDQASDFSNLRQNGLVRIVFPLPANMRVVDPATGQLSAVADVWRSVPTVNNVALSGPDLVNNQWFRGPNPFGGYQLDARVATLQEQALGALQNHAAVQHAPSDQLLNDLASFERVLFTNHRIRAVADALRTGATPL